MMKLCAVVAAVAIASSGSVLADPSMSASGPIKVTTGSTFDALGSAPAFVMSPLEMQGVVGAGGGTFLIVFFHRVLALDKCECLDPLFNFTGAPFGALFTVILGNPSEPPIVIEF